MKRTASNVLEAERIAALATIPSHTLPKWMDPSLRHELMQALDTWTTLQRGDGKPHERAAALTLLAIRRLEEPADADEIPFVRSTAGNLGTARHAELTRFVHEFFRIASPLPHPPTLLAALRLDPSATRPDYDFPFAPSDLEKWKTALAKARRGQSRGD